MRGSIGRVLVASDVVQNEVIARQDFSPSGLTAVKNLVCHKPFEILVVEANMDGVFRSFKVVTPVFYTLDDSKHFAVMDVVIAFCSGAFARPIRDGVKKAFVGLRNDARDGESRRIGMKSNSRGRA